MRHRKRKSARLVIGDLLFQDGVERKRADRTLAKALVLERKALFDGASRSE